MKKTSFLRDTVAVLTSRVTVIAFGLGATVVTARYLSPEANGIIAALMVYPSLFMTIGSLGIRQSTTYFVGQAKYPFKDIYGAVLAVWLFTSVFCMVSCYLLIKYTTKGHYSNDLIMLAIIGIPFSLYITYCSGIFLGKQNIKEFNRVNWLPIAINLVFTFLLIAIFPFGIQGSMVGTFAGVFFLFFVVLYKMSKQTSFIPIFNWEIIKKMLSLGAVYAISLLIINLNYRVDIIILERVGTDYELGIYSKGVTIINYLWEIPMLISTLVFSRSSASKDPHQFSIKVCQLLRFAGIGLAIASVLLYFLSGLIVSVLYGPKFVGCVMVLKLLMPGVLIMGIYKVLNMDLAGKGKPWLAMIAMIPAVILNIILNYMWIPKYGANGSSLASTVTYSLSAIIFLFLYSREVKIPIREIFRFTQDDVVVFKQLLGKLKLKRLAGSK